MGGLPRALNETLDLNAIALGAYWCKERAMPLAVPATRSAISIADIPGFDSGHHWDAVPICRP
jgi:hypothetical protein